jgi:predicted Abi (CAAX) family protease
VSAPRLADVSIPWSGRTFTKWLVAILVTATAGIVATALTDRGMDVFESPLLVPTAGVLAVLCALAGWAVPAAGLLWGVVALVPYVVGFLLTTNGDEGLAPVGLILLVALMAVPWLFGVVASIARRVRRR